MKRKLKYPAKMNVDSANDNNNNDSAVKNLLKYKCSFEDCKQYFRREKDLDKHEFQHTGVAKYVCTYQDCIKSYILRAHLKRHIQTFHGKNKKRTKRTIECKIKSCNKSFANKYNMERHLTLYHEKTKEFECPDCDKVYERKNHLRLHRITHTKEFPFKCYKCEKGFVSDTIFKRHNCCPNHYCVKCDETFTKWSEFVQHRQEKHPILLCKKCHKQCDTKDDFRMHMKEHREKYKCTWEGCTRSYFYGKNLKSHIIAIHLGNKLKCTYEGCNVELSSKLTLKYHLRLHESKKNKVTKIRKKRKDAGIEKKSMVALLSNFVVKPEIDKLLKENIDNVVIENVLEMEQDDETPETDGEDRGSLIQLELKT